MCEIFYITGANKEDENAKQITYDEAKELFLVEQNKKKVGIICSVFMDQIEPVLIHKEIRYFADGIDFFDGVVGKGVYYEKINENKYFIDQVTYVNLEYNNQKLDVELNFRGCSFSEPNICMIRVKSNNITTYYKANIYDDKFFYRTLNFDDTDIMYKDIEMSYKNYLFNYRKTNSNFEVI